MLGEALPDVEDVEEAEEVREVASRRRHPQLGPTHPKMLQRGGQTSRGVQTHLHSRVVKNIINLGKMLIGVKNQAPARGRTSGFLNQLNEIQTSLRE